MGCLNSQGQFAHWFGNIHLSGPCNRSCYFCIGQHMMALDSFNTLDVFPLPGLDEFIEHCRARHVQTVYLTGTNTDPLLYRHISSLFARIYTAGFRLGIRTNGIAFTPERWIWFDEASVTVCSLNPKISHAMMGGPPPDLPRILEHSRQYDLKVNIVLGPENLHEIEETLTALARMGVPRVNLREPYGQPNQSNPMRFYRQTGTRYGMPFYDWDGMEVLYWDVHYVEVESVNLYASGRVSEAYPITQGCSDDGRVQPQSEFTGGRVRMQWVGTAHV
jgi:sulfatase maturation enzyme AslB (radical SAM superfamily)